MATAIITSEDAQKFATPVVSAVVSQARSLTVDDNDSCEMAHIFLQSVAAKKKQVREVFDPIVTKAHEAHKEACLQRDKFLKPLEAAEVEVKGKVIQFNQEQERIRRLKEQEESDRLRREAEARAIAEAEQLEASGEKELADIVLQEAAAAPPPTAVVQSTVPRTSGISMREEWDFRYTPDEAQALRTLVRAAAKDESLLGLLMINEKNVRAMVKSQKSLCKIPGVVPYKRPNISVKAG